MVKFLTDAFNQDWSGLFLWINPPFSLLDEVVEKIITTDVRAVLIMPDWKHRKFWSKIQALVVEEYHIPAGSRLFELPDRKLRPTQWASWGYYVKGPLPTHARMHPSLAPHELPLAYRGES